MLNKLTHRDLPLAMLLYPKNQHVQGSKKKPKLSLIGALHYLFSSLCRQNLLVFEINNIIEIRFGCIGENGIKFEFVITSINQRSSESSALDTKA